MSFIRARSKTGRRKHRGGSSSMLTDVLGDTRGIRIPVKKQYGKRSTYDRAAQPLNERQAMVFAQIGTEPITTKALREATGLSSSQTGDVLSALAGRGLVRRAGPALWVREESG